MIRTPEALAAAWAVVRPSHDDHGAWPMIPAFLSRAAWRQTEFGSLRRIIARVIDGSPDVFRRLDYGWATVRDAYEFPAEALNQHRILSALAALDAGAAGDGLAARQTNVWDFRSSTPRVLPSGEWRFVVVPYGWESFVELVLQAVLRHAADRGAVPAFIEGVEGMPEDWRCAARGLVLSSIDLGGLDVARPGLLAIVRDAVPWFGGALVGQTEVRTPSVDALWALCLDFTISHEVAHVLKSHRSGEGDPASIEIEADHVAMDALRRWPEPRYMEGLSRDRSHGFYTAVAVLLFYFVIIVRWAAFRFAGHDIDDAEVDMHDGRIWRLLDSYAHMMTAGAEGMPTTPEWAEVDDLLTTFHDFLRDFVELGETFRSKDLPLARAAVAAASRQISRDLNALDEGRLTLPEAL